MAGKSSARTWFDEIVESPDPFAFLTALSEAEPPTFEEEWREFKGNPKAADILPLWSKAVSGFANTGGGVVVWGIDARSEGGVDAIKGQFLIKDPTSLHSTLQQNIYAATNPPVQGIEIQHYAGNTGEGFVVCFIPEGESKPHRAEQAGKGKPYFIRAGGSFVVPDPAILRQMFFPKSAPVIRISGIANEGTYHFDSTPGQRAIFINIEVKNEGQNTARDVVLAVNTKMDGEWSVQGHWQKLDGMGGKAGFECQRPLHPGMSVQCFRLTIHYPIQMNGLVDPINFAVYCRDAERRLLLLDISDDDVFRLRHVEAQQKPKAT